MNECPSFIRPRMYGSTDIQVLRTRISPSPGSGTSVVAGTKFSGVGSPTGRAARRISREVVVVVSVVVVPREVVVMGAACKGARTNR
ncbi:hypothetical protein GCM10019016_030880 [Streptomyces prasinosporus]|uniref:Uncharacterized protein n=1 Tax=Streptomyces prasinosporus TaxID=68256 RepID=A0ABP6TNE9_9ACTN